MTSLAREGNTMISCHNRIALCLAAGLALLATTTALAAAPEPCKVITVEAWSRIMGDAAKATPGEAMCTYEGSKGGGQLRIISVTGSAAEAQTSAKRMQDRMAGNPNAWRGVTESQGPVIFSISLFQKAPIEGTAAQLQKLIAAAKQNLPK